MGDRHVAVTARSAVDATWRLQAMPKDTKIIKQAIKKKGGTVAAGQPEQGPYSCYYRLPECCNQPLKETTNPAQWFRLAEPKTKEACEEAMKKVQWWCCMWKIPEQRPQMQWSARPVSKWASPAEKTATCPTKLKLKTAEETVSAAVLQCSNVAQGAGRDKCCEEHCRPAKVTYLRPKQDCQDKCQKAPVDHS